MKIFFCLLTVGLSITSQTCCAQARDISLATLKSSKVSNATATITQFRGSAAFTMVPTKEMNPGANNQGPLAILNEVQFHNGSIDVDVAGAPAKGADDSARGFIGVAFRVQSANRFEIIYLRPTNSNA